ncbi:MAG: DUF1275 domain-containing protein [Verrucomicrobiaceae bacterium]|nr:MAG: DUF1275 domain-containing protein [Verrucomicrobiaceae bacterium]
MISKLPRWVWTGAWVLAFIAGIVNAVCLIGAGHRSVTHLTGTTTMLSITLSLPDFEGAGHFVLLLGSFIAGTALSGLIIEDTALKLGRRYPVALLLESGLLCGAAALLKSQNTLGYSLAACACGLQNAMATTYSGTVVRTTHVSGMFTDLGISLGHALRRHPVDCRRVRLSVIVITGFFCGGVAGAVLFQCAGYGALLVPAGMTAAAAMGYGWHTWRARAGEG